MKLSEKILYLRKEKGWSQEHLASKLDVSRQAVYKWEAGLALPEIDKIKKLSDIFNITYDNLMNDEISLPLINKEASSKEQSNNDDAEIEITAPSEEGCSCKAEEKKEGVPCPRCGFVEADSSAFCSECGHSLLNSAEKSPDIKMPTGGFCTSCGAVLSSDSLFCMECGTAVADMKIPEKSEIDAPAQPKKRSKKPLLITLIIVLSVLFTAGIIFTAVYLLNANSTFKVTFVSDGEVVHTERYTVGDALGDDFAPSKKGYRFTGWSSYQDGNVNYSPNHIFTSNESITLYAVWEPINYVISYRLNGGVNDLNNPHSYNIGDIVTLYDPTREDFTFAGWYADEELTTPISQASFDDGGNVFVYAKWEPHDFVYSFLGNGYCISSYSGKAETVVIPGTYNGYPVTSISSQVFLNNTSIKKIIFPKETTSITASAFNGCTSLESFVVADDNAYYKAVDGVLYNKDLTCIVRYPEGKIGTEYTVPSSVISVGFCSFRGASKLQSITLNPGIETIEDSAFEGCTSLTEIQLPSSLVFICDESFKKCWSLKEISVSGSSLRQIGISAFEECLALESVSFPNSLYEICDSAFKKCSSLKEFDLKYIEVLGSNVFERSGISKIFIPVHTQTIGSNLFLSCENTIVLCESSSKQSGWQSNWSNGASAVFFGKSSINSSAFEFTFEKTGTGTVKITSCVGAGVVTIPEQTDYFYITEIGDFAFSGESRITEIVLSKYIEKISPTAFNDCTELEKLSVSTENTHFVSQNGILYNIDKSEIVRYPQAIKNTSFVVPNCVHTVSPYAFYGCSYLKTVVFPYDGTSSVGISIIGEGAFEACSGLESVDLGILTNAFGKSCFKDCASLGSIVIKCDYVSEISESAFENCINLRSVDIKGSIDSIGLYAFKGCSFLSSLNLGKPSHISTGAFEDCVSLRKILIPGNVEYIGASAFAGCTKLTVYCFANQKPASWERDWDADLLAVVWGAHSIPSSESSFTYSGSGSTITITGCNDVGVVTIPQMIDSKVVVAIGAGAFSNLYGITEIVIPATVKTIDISAFENCFDLQKITYEGSPTYYGSIDGVLYADNNKLLLKYPEGKTDESFTVPTRVDIIKNSAFKNNEFIKHITLPDDVGGDNYVGKIEAYAFYGCTSLENINLGHVNYFERECFKNCQSLKSVTFEAENVWGIGNDAFLGCISLESVTFLGNVSEIGYQCFEGCASLESVQFAKNCDKLSSRTFSNCTSLKEIALPANLASIHTETFFACASLEKVTMSSTITKIESDAFKSCVLLKEIYLHKEITSIGKGAFSGCVDLTIKCEADLLPSGYEDGWCDDLSKVILNASKS